MTLDIPSNRSDRLELLQASGDFDNVMGQFKHYMESVSWNPESWDNAELYVHTLHHEYENGDKGAPGSYRVWWGIRTPIFLTGGSFGPRYRYDGWGDIYVPVSDVAGGGYDEYTSVRVRSRAYTNVDSTKETYELAQWGSDQEHGLFDQWDRPTPEKIIAGTLTQQKLGVL